MKYLKTTVDCNDADYSTSFKSITNEQLALIKPLIDAIRAFRPYKVKLEDGLTWTHRHNFPFGDCHREDLGEKIPDQLYVESGLVSQEAMDVFCEDFIPYPEGGFHTIESIELVEVISVTKLL